ncbi:hypothetical protein WISP_11984 [Willisornis vidua]|uniref:Uncharacterized protein n=1 Tax=Willisornis vidua TaxID=1566151 RepID=A0ABQ9DWL7_9PASS|nr:hypothetical protein WISP_11984 [Willisornis vidua]
MGITWRTLESPADNKISEEGGVGDAPAARAEIPLQPMVKTLLSQTVLLEPEEAHGGAEIHLQPLEDPTLDKVNTGQHCGFVAKKASGILGCMRWSFASRSSEVILPLHSSLVRPQLEYCAQLWASYYKRDMELVEIVQQTVT